MRPSPIIRNTIYVITTDKIGGFDYMKASIIWKKLNLQTDRIITSSRIRSIARDINKNEDRTLYYLQEEGYIVRILRGIFYVRSPDEKMRKGLDRSVFELVGMALDRKGVKKWYYALETALSLNGMTHEYCDIAYVYTDNFRTTKPITIVGSRFKFLKRDERFFGYGMISDKNYQYSDPERTVLDLTYQAYLCDITGKDMIGPIIEYTPSLDMERFHEYSRHYPKRFIRSLEEKLCCNSSR